MVINVALQNIVSDLIVIFALKRVLSRHEVVRYATHRPDVDLFWYVFNLVFKQLGRHEIDRAARNIFRLPISLCVASESEICQFDEDFLFFLVRNKNVLWFEVPVHDVLRVQAAQRHEQLLNDVDDLPLAKALLLHK